MRLAETSGSMRMSAMARLAAKRSHDVAYRQWDQIVYMFEGPR